MQTKVKNISGSRSRRNSKTVVRKGNQKRKNGSGESGENITSANGLGFHFLAKKLKSISFLEMALNGWDKCTELIKTINSEEKQLQAITDLFSIVKAQPRYKNLKEPYFPVQTEPAIVLLWVLRKLGPLAKGNEWTVDTFIDNGKQRFQFVVYKRFNTQKLKNRFEHFSLEFLPYLKPRDIELHDLIIDIVALVSKCNNIPLWDEDGDFSKQIEILTEQTDNQNSIIMSQISFYKSGPAVEYLNLIRQRIKVVDEKIIQQKIKIYNNKSGRQNQILWWIRNGLRLAASKQNLSPWTFVPGYINGNPVTPYRTFKFVWSTHDNDIIYKKAISQLRKDLNNYDAIPLQFTIAKPGELLKDIQPSSFPENLYEFVAQGISHTQYSFRDYYYKKMLASKQPPTTLLGILELQEIKQIS